MQNNNFVQPLRSSKDQVVNKEGLEMMELFDDVGLSMLNGNKDGDWEGATTHVDYRSTSVIDYGAANESAWDDIIDFRVGIGIKSDHFPLEVTLNAALRTKEAEAHRWIQLYSKENVTVYQQNLISARVANCTEWAGLAKGMLGATVKKRVKAERTINSWWNTECFIARNAAKSALRRAKKSDDWAEYRETRKSYKNVIIRSKKELEERQMNELCEVKDIQQAWKYITRHRKNNRTSTIMPEEDQLTKHFMKLLNGQNESELDVRPYQDQRVPGLIVKISKEEFKRHVLKMKKGKAAGNDQLKPEALLFADEEI